MTESRPPTISWESFRGLFARRGDPYAGVDLPTSRNAVAALSLLNGALALGFLVLFPPTEALGAVVGWLVAGASVALNLAVGVWLIGDRRRVSFNVLLGLTYAGIGQVLLLQVLAQETVPFQLLLLVWVGAGAVQPTGRAAVLLLSLLLVAFAPLVTGLPSDGAREVAGRALLFGTAGMVLIGYVSYVRTQRIRLRTGEREARAEAVAATKRVRDLQWVTDAALAPLPPVDLLTRLLERIVAAFGVDYGAVLMRGDDDRRFVLGASHRAVAGVADPEHPAADDFAARVAAERRPITLEELDRHEAEKVLLEGAKSMLGVPLLIGRELVGVLYLATRSRRRFSDDDATLLLLIGDRVALAIDRARAFERKRQIAETLQRSLLPDELPSIPGTRSATRYLPAAAGIEVGGDWYDLLELRDRRIALAMGDVAGRGVLAAALMGKLRTALQAYALEGRSPGEVVERLNALMVQRQHRADMATLLYIVLDPDEGTAQLANAGHLPPLVRDAEGSVQYLPSATSPPLGAVSYARFEEHRAAIGWGSSLLLFTDGLVERPATSLELQLEELRRTVQAGPREPEALCEQVVRSMLSDAAPRDDVALLALELVPLAKEGLVLKFPAEPEALASVRTSLDRWLKQVPASEQDVYAIKLACGEACANAVEHAYRPLDETFQLELRHRDGEILIAIRDSGEWRAGRGAHRGRGLALMDALMDSAEVTSSSEGTSVLLRRRLVQERL